MSAPSGANAALHAAAPWIVRVSLAIVIAVGLAAPFLLAPMQALWVAPLLLIASLGGWIGWRAYAAVPPAPVAAAAVVAAPKIVGAPASPNFALQEELDKLRNVQRELLQAKQDAEAAMMAKSEFLATMSHEIRTPLNGIIPLLDIVLSTKLAPDQKDYLQTAYKSARELLRIVDDILDYSKIEASKLELEAVGINLREVLDSVRRLLEKSAEAKGLKFDVVIDPGVRLAVRGDPVRLRQVLSNLVSNAIKFTSKGGVTVAVTKRGESRSHYEVLFEVKDSGVGIASGAAAKLFQPFSQADTSTTRIHGGTGLGLVICKRIVDLMKGTIGVNSELGKGSTFWFSVPFLKAVGDLPAGRRDLNGSRVLTLGADPAVLRRLSGYFGAWGISASQSSAAPDALAKLRHAASMGEAWSTDLLVIDIGTMRANSVALVRNVLRDPTLERLRLLYLLGDEPVPPEIANEPRALAVRRQYSESELNAALHKLLEIAPHGAPEARPAEPVLASAPPQVQITEPEAAARPLSGHVLLVEDNPVNRQVAQRLLSLIGLSFVVAENGKEALEKLDQHAFDAVLMDCQMPVMDGYTATRVRRQKEAGNTQSSSLARRVPIIAMTANAMAGDREKCLGAGMDDYMSKPLNRALLEQTLRRWLAESARTLPAHTHPVAAPSAPKPAAPAPMRSALPDASAAKPALDRGVIADLVDIMGDEFTDLVHVYLEDTPKSLAAIEQAAQRRDIQGMIAPSHSLKSTSANLGALTLSDFAKRLEYAARSGALDSEPLAIAADLQREYQRVSVELNQLLTRSSA
ncbi:MAG TPA: ATP-binding protein [Rudaea sp.]